MNEDLHHRIDNDFGYHKATAETGPMHDATRAKFIELAHWLVDYTPAGRHQSMAISELQLSLMLSNAAIAVALSPLE